MFKLSTLTAAVVAASFALGAQATTLVLSADGTWNEFNVAEDLAAAGNEARWIDYFQDAANPARQGDGSVLSFSFTIAQGYVGSLTVVDAGSYGDVYDVLNNGVSLGTTSAVAPVDLGSYAGDFVFNYDAALADANYSRGVFTLQAGTYNISGVLVQAATLDGAPFRYTPGAVKLEVSAVPEPSSLVLLLAGVAALGAIARRRAA